MPSTETLLIFTAAALLMNISPGPSNFYVMARSIAHGPGAGAVAAAGLAAGSMAHVLAAAFGLSALISYSAEAYTLFKLAGAAYLIWLGIQYLRAKPTTGLPLQDRDRRSTPRVLRESFFVEVLNPKTALFFLALLPQFVDPAAGAVTPQFLVLGLIVTVTALPCDLLVAFASGSMARLLARKPVYQRIQNVCAGGVLIGLGAYVAFAKRT